MIKSLGNRTFRLGECQLDLEFFQSIIVLVNILFGVCIIVFAVIQYLISDR